MALELKDIVGMTLGAIGTALGIFNTYTAARRQRETLKIRRDGGQIVIANTGGVSVTVLKVGNSLDKVGGPCDFFKVLDLPATVAPNDAIRLPIAPSGRIFLGLQKSGVRVTATTATGKSFEAIITAPEFMPEFPQMLDTTDWGG